MSRLSRLRHAVRMNSRDTLLRELERRVGQGDLEAHVQLARARAQAGRGARQWLIYQARDADWLRRVTTYDLESGDLNRTFFNYLDLMAYFGDKDARAILKVHGRKWRTKLGPEHPVFGYQSPVALTAALAAVKHALRTCWDPAEKWTENWERLVAEENDIPHEVVAYVEGVLEEHLADPRWEQFGGRRHAIGAGNYDVPRPLPLGDRMTYLLDALGVRPTWGPAGDWRQIYLVGEGPRGRAPYAYAAAAADALILSGAWSTTPNALLAIERATDAVEYRMLQGNEFPLKRGETQRRYYSRVARAAKAEVKEAVRRELVPFLTGGIVPA